MTVSSLFFHLQRFSGHVASARDSTVYFSPTLSSRYIYNYFLPDTTVSSSSNTKPSKATSTREEVEEEQTMMVPIKLKASCLTLMKSDGIVSLFLTSLQGFILQVHLEGW